MRSPCRCYAVGIVRRYPWRLRPPAPQAAAADLLAAGRVMDLCRDDPVLSQWVLRARDGCDPATPRPSWCEVLRQIEE